MYYFVLLYLSLIQLAAASAIFGMTIMHNDTGKRHLFEGMAFLGLLTSVFVLFFLGAHSTAIFYNGYFYPLLVISLGTVLVSVMLAYSYISRPCMFIGLMLLLIYGMFLYGAMGRFAYGIGVFGIGTAYGLIYKEASSAKSMGKRSNVHVETSRDLFQIALGIMVMLIIAIGRAGVPLLAVLMVAAYALNNSIPNSKSNSALYGMLGRFERRGSTYGIGAAYILAGTAMLVGFVSSTAFLEASIAILFIGDALATIIGMHIGIARLPYSKRKSVGGFLAFAAVSAVSFYAFGGALVLSIALAIALAFVESVSTHFDDNITVPLALIVAFYLLSPLI
ncbi:MAG: hypothetical protein M1360_03565 [Candidatus Marsarchaeota archaeon]|jgi:dolichol kinase|nr:hypothetical protein [Candidatus Marsarchaeota archaeon]MCL5418991.1 hypothetical protein [Candidatus Marsarchaeota archaeon]